jgi:cellulose synthase/poly-beta-1,6-N-acetylglucosamine synthase-like glycosyltransferase
VTTLGIALITILLCIIGCLSVFATTTLCWMLYAWRDDTGPSKVDIKGEQPPGAHLSFSIIVPARHEELVLERTLRRLCEIACPRLEIIAVVGSDDDATRAAAERAASAFPERLSVVLDRSPVKSKPASLNTGLAVCTGDVVGVFDAEDLVHPHLLEEIERRMLAEDLDALQAGVQLMNYWSSWYAVRNVLEYFFWFRSRMHFQAAHRFVPLGGNTVFVRRTILESLGGWDPSCLAEDCDLGVRLSVAGARIGVAYDAALVTREEVPVTTGAFVRQRCRWSQGFIQVYRKGDWTRLPTRSQRFFARYVLLSPLMQAFGGVIFPIAVATAFFARIPAGLALLTWLPVLPTLATIAVEVTVLGEFCRTFGTKPRTRDRLRLILGAPAYQVLLAVAATRAIWRELRGAQGWEKTHHAGLHMGSMPAGVTLNVPRVIVIPSASIEPAHTR